MNEANKKRPVPAEWGVRLPEKPVPTLEAGAGFFAPAYCRGRKFGKRQTETETGRI